MYGYDAMKVLLPLFIPMLAALVGLQAGVLVFTRYRGVALWRNRLLWAAVLVAGIAAMLPNSGQRMFDLGFSLPLIDLIENGSYFLFFFALMGAWTLFGQGWKRWGCSRSPATRIFSMSMSGAMGARYSRRYFGKG